MASKKYRLKSGEIFDRLVRHGVDDSAIHGVDTQEIQQIQGRAQALIKQTNEHLKRHFDTFVERETYRQIIKQNGGVEPSKPSKIPSVSNSSFEQNRNAAKQEVTLRYKMRLLQIEHSSQRMQLKATSHMKQVSGIAKAHRIKERGASMKINMRKHFKKHYRSFVKQELKRVSTGELQTKQDKLLSLEKAQNKVLTRLNKRMKKIDRVTNKMYQRKIKQTKTINQSRIRMKR